MSAREGARIGVLGGAFAVLVGGVSLLLHAAALLFITGWGQGPRSDSERLEAGIAALAIVPMIGLASLSAVIVWLGISAVRDARGQRSGAAAGRLMLVFGLMAVGGAYVGITSGSWIVMAAAALVGLGTWLNGRALWAAHRGQDPTTEQKPS